MLDIRSNAVLIIDLQNDFLHPKGAYGRAGLKNSDLAALPDRIFPLVKRIREKGGWVVSSQFTLIPGKEEKPFISNHLQKLRPFLGKGDFCPGSWGHNLVDNLKPADLVVEKVAYSAFYMSRLEWILKKAGIKHLYICGIVTNGGIASTVRDAHLREIDVTILSDGCAAFSAQVHDQSLSDLSTIAKIIKCNDALKIIEAL